jgi:hypothetical protein
MNRELNHHQRDNSSREYREHQPSGDSLVPNSQLPHVRGKAGLRGNSVRGFLSIAVESRYFCGLRHQPGNSIRIVAFHSANIITGISGSDGRERRRGQAAIAVSRK